MRVHRRVAAMGVVLLAVALTACAPALPDSVVPGTKVTAGWPGTLTSLNPLASPTRGNVDIAAMTRSGFGDTVDGSFVADESFGTVTITGDEPFTVRYDLAEPAWSDGIPVDAADLLLGWAATAGVLSRTADDAEPAPEPAVPAVDEFARAIEVTFPQPTILWQSAVAVPVPAHVVGQRAFDLSDAMEAKQAVIRAIQQNDTSALDEIAAVFSDDFEIGERAGLPDDLLLSSGPFQVDAIDDEGRSVTLVPNPSYRGAGSPQVARVDLVPPGDDPVTAVGDALDVVQVAPTAENRDPIHELERRDFLVQPTHDGTVWTVGLDSAGVFAKPAARTAFLRTLPASEMVDRGAGEWASAYTATTSVLSAPGSRAYDIVSEDAGFTDALGTPDDEPAQAREAAGVADGARVCVLYDRGSTFAKGVFSALRETADEAGWNAVDCGSDDVDAALDGGNWDAVITRMPIPQTPAQISRQWGGDEDRDALIAQLAQTVDVYEAREILAQIEATIIREAVVRPFAVNPVVTISDPGVTTVSVRNGPVAPLTSGAAQWAVVR